MKTNKKGLANSLLAIVIVLFTFALFSIFGLVAWQEYDNAVQGLDNSTVDQATKDKVSGLDVYILWGDDLFVWLFVALLGGFIISSVTIPVEDQVWLVVYFVFIVLVSILAMMFSNAWTYVLSMDLFTSFATDMPFTDHIMRMFPIYTFVVGLIGGILFYLRKKNDLGTFQQGGVGFD